MKKIIFVLLSVFCFSAQAQQNAVLNIDDNDEFESFGLLNDSLLQNYRLFFTGEDHRFRKSNSLLELKMFKYLHKTAGVRVLLVEFGEGLGHIINNFVQNGDSVSQQILEKFLYKEYYQQVEGLRSFYTSLGEDEKFSVRGVDIERSPLFAVKKLEMLLPDRNTAHDSILVTADAIKSLSEFFDNNRTRSDFFDDEDGYGFGSDDYTPNKSSIDASLTLKLVLANFAAHKEKYKPFLGENFTAFETTINNITEFYYWRELEGTAQYALFRESRMEHALQALFSESDDIKAYGQFGRCHTQRSREKAECPYYYFNSLATRINTSTNPQLAGKVFSCAIFYPQMYDFYEDLSALNEGINSLAKKSEKEKLTLYLLDSANNINAKFQQRFNAVIINNLKYDGGDEDEESAYDSFHSPTRTGIVAEGGISGYNFDALNKALNTNFTNEPQFFGVSFLLTQNKGLNYKNSFLFFLPVDKKLNDSSSITLKGFRIATQFGKDIIKSRRIDLAPFLGIGYERWKLESREDFTNNANKDVLGKNRATVYTNPGFFINAGIDLRVYINRATLGFFAHYQADLSKQAWRRNGEIIGGTPRLSLSAYTVGASLGFNFF